MYKHQEAKRVEGSTSILREWYDNERCWMAPVSEDGDDGAAAGNIVRDEVQVIATGGGSLGWTYSQRRRSVATNQHHVAQAPWVNEELTW